MQKTITFRLKTGKKEGTYSLKKGVAKKDGILKNISYRPGTSSIFDEDNKDSVVNPRPVVLKYNNHANNPAIELVVSTSNGLLVDFLKSHQKFGVDYDIYDEDKVAEQEINKYDSVERALSYVNASDDYDAKAGALAVFGFNYFSKSYSVCRAALKQTAINNPDKINNVYENKSFQSRYLSSLMYCHEIIKNNPTNTAVVWTENGGVIVPIVQGENGLDTITEFLYRGTDDSLNLLQKFSNIIDEISSKPRSNEVHTDLLSEKDKRIAELEKQLASSQNTNPANLDKGDGTEDSKKTNSQEPDTLTLEKATELYFEKTKENVPLRYKNNLEWITSKLKD